MTSSSSRGPEQGPASAAGTFRLDELEPGPPVPRAQTPPPAARASPRSPLTGEQWALLVFVLLEIAAFFLLFVRLGDSQWFRLTADDGAFLVDRDLGDVGDLLRPHFGHWVTLPMVVYRALFSVAGFDYRPYLATVVVVHLAVVALLRVIMRRVGVGPWLATAVAASLLLFGSGRDNIVWSFQISFTAAAAFGLVHLIMSDHDGPLDRRDWLGLLAGFLGLLCSGVAPVMVCIVGLAVLVRRGWRPAVFHTVPLGAVYALWYLSQRDEIELQTRMLTTTYGPGQALSFVWNGVTGSFQALGGSAVVGVAVAAVLIGGLVAAWAPMTWAEFRRRGAMPAALLVGGVLFLAVAGQQRSRFGIAHAVESRYLYLLVAFMLPAFGVAAAALSRLWRFAAVPAVALLLIGMPHNVEQFDRPPDNVWSEGALALRDLMETAPRSPLAAQVPGWITPAPDLAPTMTIEWLAAQLRAGRIPEPEGDTSAIEAQLPLRFGLAPLAASEIDLEETCQEISADTELRPELGDTIRSEAAVSAWLLDDQGDPGFGPFTYRPRRGIGTVVGVMLPDLHLRVTGATQLCR